ncbi:hypothetical protein CK203_001367 [Vitis vinifera]|uniref:Uncharacterized protein n=1 Tax=Vitis vinifera TaxID=29760 RepID=A0A438KL83_VITVI|nr:hypothetical protein CK203_075252 [Vitis vinifera]RVX21973.1 hypothetical protein CK203_001367 [Vitis vinifera]
MGNIIREVTAEAAWVPLSFLAIYLEPLAMALENEKWSLVQLLLSSSYSGYGISSLKQVTYVAFS